MQSNSINCSNAVFHASLVDYLGSEGTWVKVFNSRLYRRLCVFSNLLYSKVVAALQGIEEAKAISALKSFYRSGNSY